MHSLETTTAKAPDAHVCDALLHGAETSVVGGQGLCRRRAGGSVLLESVFVTVRHRTVRSKGALSQKTAKRIIFRRVQAAARTWRRLNGAQQAPLVIEGVTCTDDVAADDTATRAA